MATGSHSCRVGSVKLCSGRSKREQQRVRSSACRAMWLIWNMLQGLEVTLEQLKGRLSDKVTKEERVAKRDAEAYARVKRAFLTNKGEPSLWQ